MITLASDSKLITSKLSGKNLNLLRIQSAVKDLRENQRFGDGLPEESVNSVIELVERMQERLLRLVRKTIPDAQPENLPKQIIQIPLRDIIDDSKALTFVFQETENSNKVHFIYQIEPNGGITFKERKEIPVIKTFY